MNVALNQHCVSTHSVIHDIAYMFFSFMTILLATITGDIFSNTASAPLGWRHLHHILGQRNTSGVDLLTMSRRWDLPELDGPAISTTLPGRRGARCSGGGRVMGGREESERERKAAAVSFTASHARGSLPASRAMARDLELSSPFFTGISKPFSAPGSILFGLRRLWFLCFSSCLRALRYGPSS